MRLQGDGEAAEVGGLGGGWGVVWGWRRRTQARERDLGQALVDVYVEVAVPVE